MRLTRQAVPAIALSAILGMTPVLSACGTPAPQDAPEATAPEGTGDPTGGSSSTEGAPSKTADDKAGKASDASSVTESTSELANAVRASMQEVADASGMEVHTAFVDLTTGDRAGIDADTAVVSASMIKLIIAETFLGQVDAGKQSLDATYVLKDDDLVGGTGVLQGRGAGAEVTYRELVQAMISESDNVATNVLIDALGMEAVNDEAESLGLTGTRLNRRMMDMDAVNAGVENFVTADDVATLLKMVYDKTFVNAQMSALMLEALEAQSDDVGILTGLPADVVFAHKTGSLSTVRHDGGIAESDRPFVLVVLCGGQGFTEDGALGTMGKMGAAVYEDLMAGADGSLSATDLEAAGQAAGTGQATASDAVEGAEPGPADAAGV